MRQFLFAILVLSLCSPALAGSLDQSLGGFLKSVGDVTKDVAPATPLNHKSEQPSGQEMNAGLKQALTHGVRYAVEQLGAADGFLGNELVRIAMPGQLKKVADILRGMGQGKLVDDFVTSMNRAAEKAVPATADILVGAVEGMSVDDAKAILSGPDDAATQYFERTTRKDLSGLVRPIVTEAMEAAQVTRYYKLMRQSAGGLTSMLTGDQDLDQYVTTETLDGLFLTIAEKEADIRNNPLARNTDLLKKVFGAF